MLIRLERIWPTFERVWVTGGRDDFLEAVKRWCATHAKCADGSLDHLSVDDRESPDEDLYRVWVYCECGRKLLVLGQPNGGDMPPIFPRHSMTDRVDLELAHRGG